MPLPRGMFKRGRSYYLRQRKDGKDCWRSLGSDYAKALDMCDRIRSGREETSAPLGTVAELGKRWLSILPTRRTAAGVRDVTARWNAYLVPFLGDVRANELSPGRIREYRMHLEAQKSSATGQPFKPETVRHFLRDMQSFCSWLEEEGYVDQSPFPKRVMPRVPDRGLERFTDAEVEKLLGLPEPYRFTVRLALATGLRWGELTRVQANDVQRDGTLVVVQPKTGKTKAIPLPPDLVQEVRGRVGKLVPFSPSSASSFTRVVRELCGISSVGSRLLRHTAACRALEGGVRLDIIQKILGHSTIRTSERYARLGDGTVRDEMRRFWRRKSGRPIQSAR